MPLPALLIPVLYSAGFGAVIDGLISAITASGDATPEAIEQAKQEFIASGLPDDVAQRMAEDVASEVTTGDRIQAGIGGAARGAAFGALSGAAFGGLSKAASAVAPKLKSFLGRGVPAADVPVAPAPSPTMSAHPAHSAPIGAGGSVRRSSMPMSDAEAMAAQKVGRPAEMRQEILGELEKRPGDLEFRKNLATKDDGLQGLIDESMPKPPMGKIPEFLPGEMVSKTPSASLAPWEGLPEVEAAIVRKALAKYGRGKPFATPQDARNAVVSADAMEAMSGQRVPSFLSRVGD